MCRASMLIPNKAKTSDSLPILTSLSEDKTVCLEGVTANAPVEYNFPGVLFRPPDIPLKTKSQSVRTSRRRLPHPHNFRSNCYLRKKAETDIPDTEHQIHGIGLQRKPSATPLLSHGPVVPFSGCELLYGNGEGGGRPQDVALSNVGAWEQRANDKPKLKELDLFGNKRPVSRNSTTRKLTNLDKVSFDRNREDLRPFPNSFSCPKQSHLSANGIKNSLLRVDQFFSQRNNGGAGCEDDLLAMGTLWNPKQLQNPNVSTTTLSSKSPSTTSSSGGCISTGPLPVRRPINLSTSFSTRQLLTQSTTSTLLTIPTMGNVLRSNKEVEPKYSDPLQGAPASFQQRLMELSALEAETVRWEKAKKVKKKPKQDRDS